MYDKTFRATWAMTALDAGFWTAMRIKTKWVRDLASMVFSLFYLVAAERADEKVRKERAIMTVEHIRVSWNKGTTPYLATLQRLLRPRLTKWPPRQTKWPPRQMRIPRPSKSDYRDPVVAWLYFDGPVADLAHHSKVVLDIPDGGFVVMDPRCNDDKLFSWAAKSGLPILSLDYGKAPEHPYAYALNECFDVYVTLVRTRRRRIGMSGAHTPRIVIAGDSAGGNLAISTTLMILETSSASLDRFSGGESLPAPEGLVCFYPALDMNIGNWMTDEQMSMIRDRKLRKTNRPIARRKSMQYSDIAGIPHSDGEDDSPSERNRQARTQVRKSLAMSQAEHRATPPPPPPQAPSSSPAHEDKPPTTGSLSHHPQPLSTRLATSSMISYFNDRVLTPEMMRAMIILYIGANNRPDFSKDYLLSPVLAPDALLRRFPKTYFMTGERDPLVDDTVIFAGRLRQAKDAAAREKLGTGDADESVALDEADALEVVLLPGISHGFLQVPSLYPPAWKIFDRSAAWFGQMFTEANQQARSQPTRHPGLGESSGDEDKPLEMSMAKLPRGRSGTQPATTTAPQGQGGDGIDAGAADASSPSAAADGGSRGAGRRGGKKAAGGGQGKSKSKKMSIVKLNSSDDLLGRRMQGLANGLTGLGGED